MPLFHLKYALPKMEQRVEYCRILSWERHRERQIRDRSVFGKGFDKIVTLQIFAVRRCFWFW